MSDISIRKITRDDLPDKVRWINDSRNNQFLHYDLPLDLGKTYEWFDRIKDLEDRFDGIILVDDKPVGLIGLLSIDEDSAEFYITIGEVDVKHKGIGYQSTLLMLDYAFHILGLNKVYLYTETENIAAQGLFEKAGFVYIGLEQHQAENRGVPVNRYYYEIKRDSSAYASTK